jgi:hypothetical protein
MCSVIASIAPFLFSAILAISSPAVRYFVRKDVRSDLNELKKDPSHISQDGDKHIIPIFRRAVGTVQMITALLITIISGGFRLFQSLTVDPFVTKIFLNLILVSLASIIFLRLRTSNPYRHSVRIELNTIGEKFRVSRAPAFVLCINTLYAIVVYLIEIHILF